ncbi:MAG: 30S ribosomal protein S6 [Nitrospiria bacterium]
MNAYETIFIVKPSLSEEEMTKVIDKIKAVIQKGGGEVVASENLGKKRLAYEVRKEKRGIYIILHFKGTGAVLLELERTYRLSELIIKFITIRIKPDKLGMMLPARDEKSPSFQDREAKGRR